MTPLDAAALTPVGVGRPQQPPGLSPAALRACPSRPDAPPDGMAAGRHPLALHKITLNCGHIAFKARTAVVGSWTSCWAIMHPEQGCQTQRRIVSVVALPGQGVLW